MPALGDALSSRSPRASILIPTHDHASTLGLAVGSALNQTLPDLEVLIVGDGVTDEVRGVALALQGRDERVRFLDFPKGPHHGEVHRHTAIEQSRGAIIAYLCDDDLFMPEHIADMDAMLRDHDLVQSLNGYLDIHGGVHLYSGSLGDPAYVARLCDPAKGFNFVGITGTAHTREFYDRAQAPWETTPVGVYPDQHQWRRMLLSGNGIRGLTSERMTIIALPSHLDGRADWTPEQRAAELERWTELTRAENGQDNLDRRVAIGAIWQLTYYTMRSLEAEDRLARRTPRRRRGNENTP